MPGWALHSPRIHATHAQGHLWGEKQLLAPLRASQFGRVMYLSLTIKSVRNIAAEARLLIQFSWSGKPRTVVSQGHRVPDTTVRGTQRAVGTPMECL